MTAMHLESIGPEPFDLGWSLTVIGMKSASFAPIATRQSLH